jgi:bifunctional DNase/RNase
VKALDVLGLNMESESGMPLVLLREQEAPHRVLPIFVGGREAVAIALALTDQQPPRPLTHDLLAALIETLDAHVDHVEVTDVRDGTFLAELAVRGPQGGVNIDSRPSDAIALALRVDAPLFASETVLEEAGRLVTVEIEGEVIDDESIDEAGGLGAAPIDEATIDENVGEFRSFLDEVEPSDFETGHAPGEGTDEPSDDKPDEPPGDTGPAGPSGT